MLLASSLVENFFPSVKCHKTKCVQSNTLKEGDLSK